MPVIIRVVRMPPAAAVDAVSTSGDTLTLELQRSGSVPYSDIKAFN